MPTSPPRHRAASWKPAAVQSLHRERDRGSSSARGYDRLWQKLRLVILEREPLCRFCLAEGVITAAHDVDHIEPIAKRPDLRLDPSNLRPLCQSHHAKLTASRVQFRDERSGL
jgi:5-methylcytosine-specific restriction protein A